MSSAHARQTIPTFEQQLTASFLDLRRALDAAVRAAGLDPAEPQEVARRLGINRNLTWKLSKVIGTTDPYHALQHLPGHAAIATFLAALDRAGVARERLDAVTAARSTLDDVVATHTGDRATLDLILGSMVGGGSGEGMAQSLKLAFRGNSGVWGIQARTRASAMWVAPNPDNPALVDQALVGVLVDVRTLRPGVRCPLFKPRTYHDDGSTIHAEQHPIDPNAPRGSGPMLLSEFCSPNMPPITRLDDGQGGHVFEIDNGPVGNTGAFTCVFGSFDLQSAPRYRSDADPAAEMAMQVLLPVEHALLDLFLHKDIRLDQLPDAFCRPIGMGPRAAAHHRIPLAQRASQVSGHPPAVHTPLIPSYAAIVQRVAARLRWSLADFRLIRLHVPYAPLHTELVLRFPLDAPPG